MSDETVYEQIVRYAREAREMYWSTMGGETCAWNDAPAQWMDRVEKLVRRDEQAEPSEPAGKLPSERIQELMQEEAARLLSAGVTTMRSTEATLLAIVRYLDDQHRERLGRAPGKENA